MSDNLDNYVAMDCEMVGIGRFGTTDMIARVSIVNHEGHILMDKFVKPQHPVVDYRTPVSGIRPGDIENGEDFLCVQNQVKEILRSKILVGHSVDKDLGVLKMEHPLDRTRDTAEYRRLADIISYHKTPGLKLLARRILGISIQTGEHNSVEDARAVMRIYLNQRNNWEKDIREKKI